MTRRLSQAASAFLCLVAVAGPALLAVLAALYTGRPSPVFLALGLTLAVAILACDGWIIAGRRWITGSVALTAKLHSCFFLAATRPHSQRHRRYPIRYRKHLHPRVWQSILSQPE